MEKQLFTEKKNGISLLHHPLSMAESFWQPREWGKCAAPRAQPFSLSSPSSTLRRDNSILCQALPPAPCSRAAALHHIEFKIKRCFS